MKKRDRWLMTAALTVGVLTFAAGCGRQEETEPASASQSAVEEAEDDTSETSGTLSQEEEGKTQGTETVSVMTGTVLDAAMNSIVIQNQEYPDGIIFSKEDSAASFTDGLTLGLDATLFYTGRIQGAVSAVSGEELTVEADDKTEVTVKRGSELMELEGEPQEGDLVTVLYSCPESGTEQKQAELIR